MKLSDHQRKLLRGFLRALATIAFGYLVAFVSIFPMLSAHRMVEQMRMETWGSYAGGLQARVFFQEGHYRLLELYPITKIDADNFASKFTGKSEGSFEIWTRPVYNDTNSIFLWKWLNKDDSDQKFVESFNERMKQLWNENHTSQKTDSTSQTNSH